MKLTRIRIEQVRQFRNPFELDALDAGINLFVGPNEAGKSTVVRAIRAAFFERHRSSSIDDLVPFGESGVSPSIEIDFEIRGVAHALRKSFLQRKRCELRIGDMRLDGDEAEQHLAQLLSYEVPGRGASKADHWGIPGLLWIEQGNAQELRPSVGHATAHLQRALQRSVGEVASTQGDEIAARVQAERDALLTQAGGKPRGAFAEAEAERDRLAEELVALDARIAQYRQQVDQLARLHDEHAAEQIAKPWDAFRQQLQAAEEALVAAQGLRAKADQARATLHQHEERVQLIEQQLHAFAQQDDALREREQAVVAAEDALQSAVGLQARRVEARHAAVARHDGATRQVDEAHAAAWRIELLARRADAEARIVALADALRHAEAARVRIGTLQGLLIEHEIDPAALDALRRHMAALHDLRIREEASATRVRYALHAEGLTLDGEALQGEGERLVSTPTEMRLPNIGVVTIEPGGADLAMHRRRQAALQSDIEALLRRLRVEGLEAAEEKARRLEAAKAEHRQAELEMKTLAPQGVDALRASLDAHRQRVEDTTREIDGLPSPAPSPSLLLSHADAMRERDAAAKALDSLASQADEALAAWHAALALRDAAMRERDALKRAVEARDRSAARDEAARRLSGARAEAAVQAGQVEAIERELAAARPEILQQDVQRLERSMRHAQHGFDERQLRMTHLRGVLEAQGAQGLEEERAVLAQRAEAASRRFDELSLRAQALSLLHERLQARRRETTRRLQAPLQRHIQHYLELLFPGASLAIGEDLVPGVLSRTTRDAGRVLASASFDMLSFGAREQMGLISRLAYADLLKEAGQPTLIILDDALVHSDAERLARMKRVLFDAARRHQVLLFTCHAHLWRDLGAMPRAIAADISAVISPGMAAT